MKRILYPVLAVAIVLALFVSSAEAFRLKREWRRGFGASRGVTFRLRNRNGGVRVEAWESDSIEVAARIKIKATSKRTALKLAEKLDFDVESSPGEISIDVKSPRVRLTRFLKIFWGDENSISVSFDIRVPRNCNLEIENINGGLTISGVSGEMDIETVNGAIDIDGVDTFGEARTANGSISCTITKFGDGKSLFLSGVNGSIRLKLPRRINAVIDARSVNGGVKVRLPFVRKIKGKRSHVKGTVGDGVGRIILKTINGNIRVGTLSGVV